MFCGNCVPWNGMLYAQACTHFHVCLCSKELLPVWLRVPRSILRVSCQVVLELKNFQGNSKLGLLFPLSLLCIYHCNKCIQEWSQTFSRAIIISLSRTFSGLQRKKAYISLGFIKIKKISRIIYSSCLLTPYLPAYEYQSEEHIHTHKPYPTILDLFPSPIEFLHSLMHFMYCFQHPSFPFWFVISKGERLRIFFLVRFTAGFFFLIWKLWPSLIVCELATSSPFKV